MSKQASPRPQANHRGFTLIETMIAVAIAAILATVAYPSYSDYLLRARIGEATTNLQDMRARTEGWFQDQHTYAGLPCAATAATEHFAFSCAGNATTYTIIATGQAAMDDFIYTIDHTNARRTTALRGDWSGASGSSTCWVRRKDGSC